MGDDNNGNLERHAKGQARRQTIAARLTQLIKENGVTVAEVARDTNIPRSTLHSWTAGVAPKDFDAASRLAAALGVSLSYLLTGVCERQGVRHGASSDLMVGFHGIAEIKVERIVKKFAKGD